jgi:transposase InsO family protein/transposase-like protein
MGARTGVVAGGFPDDDRDLEWDGGAGGMPGEPGYPGSPGGAAEGGFPGAPLGRSGSARRYTAAEKAELLRLYEDSGATIEEFCSAHGVTSASLCKWRREFARYGAAALEPKPLPGNRTGPYRGAYTAEQRRQALDAFEESGLTVELFTKLWGVSRQTFSQWQERLEMEGPKGLEPRKRGRPSGTVCASPIPKAVQEEIVETKKRFPWFGLRTLRDFLFRFRGMKVSPGGVGATLDRAGVPRQERSKSRVRRKKEQPRRFERANPMDLWQSDITSFNLARQSRRVYLTVFLDDCSRYVVAFALGLHQRQDLVIETLLSGIASFGKPKEVLTDQGRQYFAWRGKAAFEKLLEREGIKHVVARAHHPQTVGKCERLWDTVYREFWTRVMPEDLADARERLARYFAHYNFFRPHASLEGATPADRFFGAEEALRRTLESKLSKDELRRAIEDPPRKSVYVFGQIGEQQLSLHGERGKLVIQTPDGVRQEMAFEELGVERAKEKDHGKCDGTGGGVGDEAGAAGQEEARVPAAGADAARGEGSVEPGDGGGAGAGAPDDGGDARGVAREDEPAGGGGAARDPARPAPPALPAGDEWDAGGALEAAASEEGEAWDDDEYGGRSDEPEEGEPAP